MDTFARDLFTHLLRLRFVAESLKRRVRVVLASSNGKHNKVIAAAEGLEVNFVVRWRNRWATAHTQWRASNAALRPPMREPLLLSWLQDNPGRGRNNHFTPDQRTKIAALSRESPESNGVPVTHWTAERLARVAISRRIVDTISIAPLPAF